MIILSTLLLLISNAVSLRRDMAILYNRIAILALLYAILQSLVCFSILSNGGIGIHGGLFHVTNITQVFHIFLYLVSILIIQLTSIYPRKLSVTKGNPDSLSGKWRIYVSEFDYIKKNFLDKKYTRDYLVILNEKGTTTLINKTEEHLKIIEYPKVALAIMKKTQFANITFRTQMIGVGGPSLLCILEGSRFRLGSLNTNSSVAYKLRIGSLNNLNICVKKRFYSQALLLTKSTKLLESPINSNISLNPWFLTGFTDGDGSFNILVSKDLKGKLLCKVNPVFTFGLHKKELPFLLKIQEYFGGVFVRPW